MASFKKWLAADSGKTSNFANQSTIISIQGPETELDPWLPDEMALSHGINFSKRSKLFPAFRRSMKDNMVLKAFRDAILMYKKNPFNYQKSNWLDDEIQKYIADTVGLRFDQTEQYSQHLKRDFVDIYKKIMISWDNPEQNNSWPGI